MKGLALTLCLLSATQAWALRRVALVAGNNTSSQNVPLRFAESDAGKIAQVLMELGGVRPDDLFLLQGRTGKEFRDTFQRAASRLKTTKDEKTLFIVYFSGHGDDTALRMGSDRVGYAELRQWISAVPADMRLAIFDSCQSGSAFRRRSLTPQQAFDVRVEDEMASRGEIFLTSSASDEMALESDELGGGLFTHAFVSALRGAADVSRDGKISLAEAYAYAFARTGVESGRTAYGLQHPSYEMKVSGSGELILTTLSHASASLRLPDGFEKAVIFDDQLGNVVAEIMVPTSATIGLPSGRYGVAMERGRAVYRGSVVLFSGQAVSLNENGLVRATPSGSRSRGSDAVQTLAVGVGSGAGAADGAPADLGLNLQWSSRSRWGVLVWAQAARGMGQPSGGLEDSLSLQAGILRTWELGSLQISAGVTGGGGVRVQNVADRRVASTPMVLVSPVGLAELPLVERVSIQAQVASTVGALRMDGKTQIRWLPNAWVGVGVRL